MGEMYLEKPVELKLPAQRNMMLVLRLTTAGVIARAGLGVDRMDEVKMAVEEAGNCLMDCENAPERLVLNFSGDRESLTIRIAPEDGCACRGMTEDELNVVQCILESLVSSVKVETCENAIAAIELRVALDA